MYSKHLHLGTWKANLIKKKKILVCFNNKTISKLSYLYLKRKILHIRRNVQLAYMFFQLFLNIFVDSIGLQLLTSYTIFYIKQNNFGKNQSFSSIFSGFRAENRFCTCVLPLHLYFETVANDVFDLERTSGRLSICSLLDYR